MLGSKKWKFLSGKGEAKKENGKNNLSPFRYNVDLMHPVKILPEFNNWENEPFNQPDMKK